MLTENILKRKALDFNQKQRNIQEMTGQYIVTTINNHSPIEGADKIVKVSCFGEVVIVDKNSTPIGTRGIVIDCLSVLDPELCSYLNLYRHSNLNQDKTKVGYIEHNSRVRAIRLRGVKCSGLFVSFDQLTQHPKINQKDLYVLKDGVQGNDIAGIPVCKQFVRKVKRNLDGSKVGKARENLVPTFKEHIDTDQLARNLDKIHHGDYVVITEKLHGTSGRFARLPVIQTTWKDRLLKVFGKNPRTKYQNVVGSRRVTKSIGGEEKKGSEHYYDADIWTQTSYEYFDNKIHKGETVYFEIVGYLPDGGLIMPSSSNKKLKSFMDKDDYKDFVAKYGDDTIFTYGCQPKEHKIFVYRITLTNEDGHSVDYCWDAVKVRCEEMGVAHVPELDRGLLLRKGIDDRDWKENFYNYCKEISEFGSRQFPSHIREGVCVRIDRGTTPVILKEKAYNFKVLEGIVKETQDTVEDEN